MIATHGRWDVCFSRPRLKIGGGGRGAGSSGNKRSCQDRRPRSIHVLQSYMRCAYVHVLSSRRASASHPTPGHPPYAIRSLYAIACARCLGDAGTPRRCNGLGLTHFPHILPVTRPREKHCPEMPGRNVSLLTVKNKCRKRLISSSYNESRSCTSDKPSSSFALNPSCGFRKPRLLDGGI